MKLSEILLVGGALVGVVLFFSLYSCSPEGLKDNSRRGNFEALWKIMDEGYCFFDYKRVDWDEVHERYAAQVTEQMTQEELFLLMADMLNELKDGHVNLRSPFDISRYTSWYEDYPANFDSKLQKNYLGRDYQIAGPLRYKKIDPEVGYVYMGSFTSTPSSANLASVMTKFIDCKGLIVDVRNNGGGLLTSAEMLASIFFKEKCLVSYSYYKNGKGHQDFSSAVPRYLSPHGSLYWGRKVVLLTNRYCYSSANDFAMLMRRAPQVIHVGDRTGGGGGLPLNSELPNGWTIQFSSAFMKDVRGEMVEHGIDPQTFINQTDADASQGKDSLIEEAIRQIKGTI